MKDPVLAAQGAEVRAAARVLRAATSTQKDAALAAIAKVPVHPVLTDSGLFWGRRAFGKRPGTIQIEVCPPLPSDIERQDFMDRLQAELARPLSPIDR